MVLRVPRGSSPLRARALTGHTGLPGRMLSWEGIDESLARAVHRRVSAAHGAEPALRLFNK